MEGIRVLEVGHAVMGPTAGLILADMGAEVIRIERTPKGDDTRYLKGFGAGFYPYFNRNKKSLCEKRLALDEVVQMIGSPPTTSGSMSGAG